jgi:thiol-disulfide isomerase/thioredoxin
MRITAKTIIVAGLSIIAVVFLAGVLFFFFLVQLFQPANTSPDSPPTWQQVDKKVAANSMQVIANIQLDDMSGKAAELPGKGRYRILNYWASWCGECIVELPVLNEYADQADSTQPMLIGIALDEPEAVSAFLTDNPSKYPHFIEYYETTDSSSALGNTSETIPYTILISPEGKLLKQQNGAFHDLKELKNFAKPLP